MPILTVDYTDLSYEEMSKAMGLKLKFMPMLIESFLEESGTILKTLESAIASKDYTSIALQAHSIKGSAGNLRLNEIYEMTKEMELSAKECDANFDYEAYFQAVKMAIATLSI